VESDESGDGSAWQQHLRGGFLIGALFAGLLGDRFGRRVVMMWTLTFFSVMTFANAFVDDWRAFAALRAIAGIGMGAEGAIIAPFLVEFVSNRYRGAFTALAGFSRSASSRRRSSATSLFR